MNPLAARKALFTPCRSKEELDRWIRVFLQIRFPDAVVSEESNSSPLQMIWELYDRAVRNDTEGFKRVMAYANRFGGKTLAAAVLETLIVLHTKRNIVHMAAIKDQSKKAQEYVKGFFYRPFLKDFVVGDNDTEVMTVAYIHRKTKIPVTEKEFSKLEVHKQDEYERKENYIRIIVCTMQSTNGQHTELLVVDEVDVIPSGNLRAYDQAKNGVPTDRGDLEAMTLFTSTRKSRIGKVQAEIDEAPTTGLVIKHWNIIDITEPCPTSRHKPELPTETLWINDVDVDHISDEKYQELSDSEKTKFYDRTGYAGCRSCRLFAACKGALATKQVGKVGEFEAGGTALLLKIPTVIDKFRGATPEFITTEFLCRKPDTSGLVYPRFNEAVHLKTAAQIAEEIEGGPVADVQTKEDLIRFLVNKNVRFATGMDFGYNHLFAVVTAAIWGAKAYVVDVIAKSHQELDDKLALCEHLKTLNSSIYPDPEDAASIATFRRKGFRMKDWTKNAGSVKAGIDIVRTKLYAKNVGPTLAFLKDETDEYLQMLSKHVRDYHFTTGTDGKFTEEPDEKNDDIPDALRYIVMNVFGKNGALRDNIGLAPVPEAVKEEHWTVKVERQNAAMFRNVISAITGQSSGIGLTENNPNKVKKGQFYWDG